ncbi:MAG: hypothetical protein JNK22_06160 [Rhodocyclaceae bacterium]|nr:hypothetical protein [Rhodocyclaceae bacterium]
MAYASQEAYFETLPGDVKVRLQQIQASVLSLIPGATKCISYSMPAFRDGRVFLYFAAFKKHIGIYPPVARDAALIQELAQFRGPKGNLAFPLGQPLPMALIERVVTALHKEYAIR